MLEVATGLVAMESWTHKQVRVDMRAQGASSWATSLFGSDGLDSVDDVLAARAQFAIINPSTAARPALLRAGGQRELAAIATIPSYDQLGLAVTRSAGVSTLGEMVQAKPALTVSLRGNRPNHSVHMVLEDTLRAAGTSLAELNSWGGEIRYDDGLPHGPVRSDAIRRGDADAVFDEGVYNWGELAGETGLVFLSVPDDVMARLEARGYRRGVVSAQRYTGLEVDVPTVDFSGFLVFTRTDTPDDVVTAFCEAIVSARERIPWQGGPSLPLEQMCADAVDAPLPLPLHAAAKQVWRSYGLLT